MAGNSGRGDRITPLSVPTSNIHAATGSALAGQAKACMVTAQPISPSTAGQMANRRVAQRAEGSTRNGWDLQLGSANGLDPNRGLVKGSRSRWDLANYLVPS